MFVLESLDSALKRGAKIYCEIAGMGVNCFGEHICRPDETGIASFKTMRTALLEAKLAPCDIDFINTHGTSTVLGDISEAESIRKLFYNPEIYEDLEALARYVPPTTTYKDDIEIKGISKKLPITAFKAHFGHTQAAVGGLETAMAIL
jgi:3-oxoacyl-(acyl-carrier-protein) synthase